MLVELLLCPVTFTGAAAGSEVNNEFGFTYVTINVSACFTVNGCLCLLEMQSTNNNNSIPGGDSPIKMTGCLSIGTA